MANEASLTDTKLLAKDLIDTAFSKIKDLGAGNEASRLFPNGIASLDLEIESGGAGKSDFRVSLRLGATLKAGPAIVSTTEADSGDDASISFNAEGHHVIALIAMQDLQARFPATATTLQGLLDSVNRTLLEAATFPDDIRMSQPQTKPFHFVDSPFQDGGPINPPLPDAPHVISKIAEFTAFLTGGGGTDQQKVDALSWLIHLFGDIHQPLHCIDHVSDDHPGGDRGGNSFKLRGKARNLHSLWDSSVDFTNADEEELAPSIMQEHNRAGLADDLDVSDVEAWARTSFKLAKKFAYNLQEDNSNPPKPSVAYLETANKIGRRQAALAGYRLSDRLKTIFG